MNNIVFAAAEEGYDDIVYDMIDNGADCWNDIARYAAGGGHIKLVMAMIETKMYNGRMVGGANDYEEIARCAAEGGHLAIVMKMIVLGASNYDNIAYWADMFDHKIIVDKMMELDANIPF